MAAATATEIKTALSSMLKLRSVEDMPDHWDAIAAQAASFAYQEVQGRLIRRGFRLAEDVANWDRLHEFTLDLGLWKSIMLGGIYSGFDGAVVQALDRRKELDETLVFVGGEWRQVASGAPGTTTTAGPSRTDGGVFGYDDTRDDLGFRW